MLLARTGIIASAGKKNWLTSVSGYSENTNRVVNYVSGDYLYTALSFTGKGVIIKSHIATGEVVLQKAYSNLSIYDLTVDSSANIYVCGSNSSTGFIAKMGASGSLSWIKSIESITNVVRNLSLDSSGNVYAASGVGSIFLTKLNNSGTKQWISNINPSPAVSATGLTMDTSGNIYVAGYDSGNNYPIINKFDSSGTLTFSKSVNKLSDTSLNITHNNGYLYVGSYGTSTTEGFAFQMSTAGVLGWTTSIQRLYSNQIKRSLSSNSTSLFVGRGDAGLFNLSISDGSTSWQRSLSIPDSTCADHFYANSQSVYFAGGKADNLFIGRFDVSGSGLGDYVSNGTTLSYTETSATTGIPSLTVSNTGYSRVLVGNNIIDATSPTVTTPSYTVSTITAF